MDMQRDSHVLPMSKANQGLHPLAVMVGALGIIIMILIVVTSSYQKDKLKHMARNFVRKKRIENDHDYTPQSGVLPTFVQQACDSGNIRVLRRWLSSSPKDINCRSSENMTALHYTSRAGHNECTRSLLQANADPNVHDERHVTPLHLAALGGHALCVKLLLDKHADPFQEDLDLQTPLQLAEKSDNIGCARLLQRAMAKSTMTQDNDNLTLRATLNRVDSAV